MHRFFIVLSKTPTWQNPITLRHFTNDTEYFWFMSTLRFFLKHTDIWFETQSFPYTYFYPILREFWLLVNCSILLITVQCNFKICIAIIYDWKESKSLLLINFIYYSRSYLDTDQFIIEFDSWQIRSIANHVSFYRLLLLQVLFVWNENHFLGYQRFYIV